MNFCSPVSGEVVDIVRGAKRKVLEIVLKSDAKIVYEGFATATAVLLPGLPTGEPVFRNEFVQPHRSISNPASAPTRHLGHHGVYRGRLPEVPGHLPGYSCGAAHARLMGTDTEPEHGPISEEKRLLTPFANKH